MNLGANFGWAAIEGSLGFDYLVEFQLDGYEKENYVVAGIEPALHMRPVHEYQQESEKGGLESLAVGERCLVIGGVVV